jgi:hypothetical protein
MEIRPDVPDNQDPSGQDESVLVGMMFEKITELRPDWPMGDRTDLAMAMLGVVKKWAHNLELTSDSSRLVDIGDESD